MSKTNKSKRQTSSPRSTKKLTPHNFEDVHKALFAIEDKFEASSLKFMLLGDIAKAILGDPDGLVSISNLEFGIQKKDLNLQRLII